MGYTTDFMGAFDVSPALTTEQHKTLMDFSKERHERDGFPGIWCDWVPSPDGTKIEHNGAEKSYNYTEWLEYIIEHFLKHWGCVLNGEVDWQGEDPSDVGTIYAKDNVVEAVPGKITNPGPSWSRK